MKYINKFKSYNLLLEGLLLESIMEYGVDFTKILELIISDRSSSSEIAKAIINTIGVDVDIPMNYIDISDNKGFLKFVQDNKVDKSSVTYMLNNNAYLYSSPSTLSLYDEDGKDAKPELKDVKFKSSNIGVYDKFKIVKRYRYPNYHNYSHLMYHLKSINDDSNVFVYVEKGKNGFISCVENKPSDIRSGRLIRNILNAIKYKYTEKDIEDFINTFYAKLDMLNKELEIVSGEDIKYWYNSTNYEAQSGSLGSSCMRYSGCSSYFGIYVENPDVCELAILKGDNGLLIGRALLWTDINGVKYMDVIYCIKDHIKHIFENWANKNGIRKISGDVIVKVEAKDYDEYPYLDSLYNYYMNEGILSNKSNLYNCYYSLCETNGSYEGPYYND